MIGETLGQKYKLVRLLGEGGMGSVYEAERRDTAEHVAVKVIHRRLLKPGSDGAQRFRREVRAVSAIDSEHIVRVLDSGSDEATGLLYLAMEYLEGEDLQHLCDRIGPLAPEGALRVAAQALAGLQKAHEGRIVHRDIKPANLFLARRRDGATTVKLLDFGIAKSIEVDPLSLPQSTHLTTTGGFLGSPLYMSPEQVQSSRDVDARTDLWSLGSVLYAAIAGRAPYEHLTSIGQLLIAICGSAPPLLSEVAPWVSPEVSEVVRRALSLQREERHASAEAMLAAIRRLLPGGSALREEMLAPVSARTRAIPAAPRIVVDRSATRPIRGDEATAADSRPPRVEQLADARHQLRAVPADFTGREEELKDLTAKMDAGGTATFGLHGQGGIGKTALALKLAEALAPRCPDAQIDLDLKGADPEPLSPSAVMAHVIHAFDPTAKLPEGEAELAGRYRSVLHGKRVLLFFDNARDRAQVEPLLAPLVGCVVIVTSRQRFTLPGLYARSLAELAPADAVALIHRIAPRVDAGSAATIAALSGYLPLALRLAASALAERVDLEPDEYVERLKSAQARFERVDASLRLSLDLLDARLSAFWCCLGVFPGDFDREAAAAVGALDLPVAREALGDLLKHSMVDYDPTAKRYRLHGLSRLYAVSRLEEAEKDGALRRHAAHFKGVAASAHELYKKGGLSITIGLALFDREWANIHAGQAWAAARAAADDAAAALCSDFPVAGAYCLALRLHPRDRIRWCEAALAAAGRLRRRGAESVHLSNLGLAYADVGEPRRAIAFHEQDLTIARELGDRRGEGQTLGNLGLAYADLGEPRRAIELYEQQLIITREIKDRRSEGNALGNLGLAYKNLGEPRRAIELIEQQLIITREIGDRRGEGIALGNLGLVYADLKEPRRAIELYEQWLTIAREIGDRRGEGAVLGNLGIAYAALAERSRAIELYEQQLIITREIGDRRGEGKTLGNLGNAYAALGEPRRAIELYEQRLTIAREIGDRQGEGHASWNLGLRHKALGEFDKAISSMQVYVDFLRSIGHGDAEKRAAAVDALRARRKG